MSAPTPAQSEAVAAEAVDDALAGLSMGEGGQVMGEGLCTLEPRGRLPVAIIGGTGYVGRLLARRLLSHPKFCLGPIVGSKRSEGMIYQDVWEEKEGALMKNYGSQLWTAMPFPPQLAGVQVASLETLLEGECKIAISCVAPDVGYIEDILTNGGVSVYSISPYKRSENLTVPEVNPAQVPYAVDKMLFKSPNCVSVGTTLALKAIDDAFGLHKVSVCTFQSLSGRGDAMYPPELVQGNIYPVWNTKERTEVYIGNEICALVNLEPNNLTVRAHRVGVHIGHFVDVRVKVKCPELLTSVEAVNRAFESFAPLSELYGPDMPSLPKQPVKVIREVGAPRPATHNMEYGGMQVAAGNIKLDDGVWDLCFSVVVNNMIRGAYGAALLMAEYHLYLKSHPAQTERLLARFGHDLMNAQPLADKGSGKAQSPAALLGASVVLPAPTTPARVNTLTSAALVSAARDECTSDHGNYHGEIAKRTLHWHHPRLNAWLTWDPAAAKWTGWTAAGEPTSLDDATWSPWHTALDDGKAPFYEWFLGGTTSAAFNEVDRHVLAGHGDETAFIGVGASAFEAALAGTPLKEECTTITRKELLAASALNAAVLREAGMVKGDTLLLLLPHCIEQMVWIEAAKRLGLIYLCLPDSISIASLAGRLFDTAAKLVITSSAKSSVEGTSHKAMVSHAVMEYVSMEAALRAIRRVLPEQRWRSNSTKVDIKAVCDALEASYKDDGAVNPSEVASKLEIVFSMQPPLREKAAALAQHLMGEMRREHAARVKTKLLVVPPPYAKAPAPAAAPAATSPGASPNASPSALRRSLTKQSTGIGSSKDLDLARQHSELVLMAEELQSKIMPAFLGAAGVESYPALLKLADEPMACAVTKAMPPAPLPSMFPKNVVYTSGSSGYKSTGLVQDTGGYTSGVANTMTTVLDATPGQDVIFTNATPSWVTGQTYAITGPLCQRVTSVLCSGMPETTMAQCLAAVVLQLKVTIFVASASFLKRALRTTWQAAWLQRQRLGDQLRIAASCGEPLSPAMHKLGMAVLTPNYINSYWASEHGAIILGKAFGNVDTPSRGDAAMYPLPWVDAEVWVPVGDANEDGRMRFKKADPTGSAEPAAVDVSDDTAGHLLQKSQAKWAELKGRLVVTKPWPSMARTVWGDAELAASDGWVGDLDTYRARYWASFCADDGEPVMALDLADLARPWPDGSFSVLGHSREELRLGVGATVVAAAELEAALLQPSSEVIDAIVVSVPHDRTHADGHAGKVISVAIGCLVMPDGVELSEGLINRLKMAVHEALDANCVPADFVRIPAIPRTHNAKPMRNVVQRLFRAEGSALNDVSEIANPACLLELKAAIDEWRFEQARPVLDERC